MINDADNYPQYAYTFQVIEINAQSGNAGIIVKYIPESANLTSISYNIPILHDFNPANMAEYVDRWAPRQQWFAQEMVIKFAEDIKSSSTANVVFEN